MRQSQDENPLGVGIYGPEDLEEIEEKASKPTQWANIKSRMYKGVQPTHPKLPSGTYVVTLDRSDSSIIFIKRDVKVDDIIKFKDSLANKIVGEIDTFWKSEKKFKESGFLHRRGYLLYGPQGSGKSIIVNQVSSDVVEKGGLVFVCGNPKFLNMALTTLRQAEPDRKVVCVFEDIDAIIKAYGEDELLSVLDGANMVDKVLNIATTNYPELLDKRIVSRPRRFDRVIKILAPNKIIRRAFLKVKLPKGQNLDLWVTKTEGMSFAGVTEAIISVCCLGNGFEDTIKILTDIENGHPSSNDFGKGKKKVGFTADDDEDEDEEDDDCPPPSKF